MLGKLKVVAPLDEISSSRLTQLLSEFESRGQLDPEDARALAAALLALARPRPAERRLRPLAERCAGALARGGAGARELADAAWALATLKLRNQRVLKCIANESIAKVATISRLHLSKLAWSFASLPFNDCQLFPAIANQAIAKMQELKSQDCSNIAWAFATARVHHCELFHKLAAGAVRSMRSFRPQELSNTAWAFARLAVREPRLLASLAGEARAKLEAFLPQHLSGLAWALAAASVDDPCCCQAVASEAGVKLRHFTPQGLSNLSWALAVCGVHDEPLFSSISSCATARIRGFTPQGIANLCWSSATLKSDELGFLRAAAAEAVARTGEFNTQDLSNVAWAFATCSIGHADAFREIAGRYSARLPQCKMQELSNVSWALAVASCAELDALEAAGDELVRRLDRFDGLGLRPGALAEFAKSVLATVWALDFAGLLGARALAAARSGLRSAGRALDGARAAPAAPAPLAPWAPRPAAAAPGEPSVALELADRLALRKPPGWEAEPGAAAAAAARGGGGHLQLLEALRARLPARRRWPISRDAEHHYGLLHRLDVPSSGLVLVAKSYTAYYDLRLQLGSGTLARDYIVLCHGHIRPRHLEVSARVGWAGESPRPSEILASGKPSLTRLKVVAHAARGKQLFSLVAVRIVTGRRHQIRVHMQYIGHPTVCDGKYTSSEIFRSDSDWCPRNFLHRYRLAFCDAKGAPQEALAPLPPDLALALGKIAPVADGASKAALRHWLRGSALPGWEDVEALPGEASAADQVVQSSEVLGSTGHRGRG